VSAYETTGVAGYGVDDLRRAADAGVRAPSLHNSQPWRFRLRAGSIEVLVDPGRALPATDPRGWAAHVACGAAAYNARLALAVAGTPARTLVRPDHREPLLAARLSPGPTRPATPTEARLFAAVPRRHSNRQPFWAAPVPADVRGALVAAATAEGAWLELLVGMTSLSAVVEIVAAADRVLRRDEHYQAELADWARVIKAPDGVPVAAAATAAEPQDLLPQRAYGGRRRAAGRDYEPEPLVAVLGGAGDTAADRIAAGQALQRVLLTATAAGLACSMVSQPIEVPAAREQLRRALHRHGAPQMLLRLGYGVPGSPTPRRPLEDVLVVPA
jgi:nitroreductase